MVEKKKKKKVNITVESGNKKTTHFGVNRPPKGVADNIKVFDKPKEDFIPAPKKEQPSDKSLTTFRPGEAGKGALTVGVNQPTGITPQEDSLGGKFAKAATKIPLGVGTSIKTVASGFARILGKQEEFEQALGTTSGKDLVTTAFTLGTLGITAYGAGALLGARTAAQGLAGAEGRAVITRTAFKHEIVKGSLKGRGAITTQRAFTGRAAKTGVGKLFKIAPKSAAITSRFATNAKSGVITKGFLVKLGVTLGVASILKDALGTYPFSGFIKEEAIQTTGFGVYQSERAGDIQGMEEAILRQEEILAAEPTIIDSIPYANVQKQLASYFESVAIKNKGDRRRLELLKLKGGL